MRGGEGWATEVVMNASRVPFAAGPAAPLPRCRYLVPVFLLWLEAASAGAAGCRRERGVHSCGDGGARLGQSHLNSSSLQAEKVGFAGGFEPARRGFGVLCFLLPYPFCTTQDTLSSPLIYACYLFPNFSGSLDFALPLTSEKWRTPPL